MPPLPADVRWILFDAVGTLIYPDPPVAPVYQAVARQFELELSAAEIRDRFASAFADEFRSSAGLAGPPTNEAGERGRWQRIVARVLRELPAAGGQPFELLWRHFAQPASWRLFDDVAPTLSELARRGYRLGIASNFDSRLHGIVQGHPPLTICERIFVSSEIGFSKPDPRYFEGVRARLAAQPEQILLVGDDRENDFDGGTAAGWQAVLVARGSPPPAIGSLAELLQI